ncbi:hypothetical protein GRI89_01465 [Altererythrobacter salegens]|uniref:Uncharacterized protein n=1 Tax=Croceibacterium salegens TaxID=1737568 RepID=A0A6I4SQV5_9SPHN|nr:sulfotransferase [Croceibacterium salegens]MXO58214.1 hypothetical protein [Croceibacterium salegens]
MTLPPGERGASGREDAAALRHVDGLQRALQRRNRGDIAAHLSGLVSLRAPMTDQWLDLALMAVDLGEPRLARDAAHLYQSHFGGSPAALMKTVGVLARLGAYDEALAVLRSIPPTEPDPFSYAITRGASAINVGEVDEAREWLRKAIAERPNSGSAWHSISQVADFAHDAELADKLMSAEPAMQAAPGKDRALYYYALSKARADIGDHAGAFAVAMRAATETKALFPYDRQLDFNIAKDAVTGYNSGRIAAMAAQGGEPTDRTIFVMGQPRSGTTLVEQILTSHSEVCDGGEIDLLRLLVHEVGDASYPALERLAVKDGPSSLARLWSHLVGERFPRPGRIVDKTTDASRKLGLAAAVLPEAPLIWLKRDPLDCAWSCFRTSFMGGIRWSNDLGDIGYNFRLEDRLLGFWQDVLGDRLLVVPFEGLATNPDLWVRTILSHCALADEPGPYAPHQNGRVVTTASAMQVRVPINRKGIGSAQPYRSFLEPFEEAYAGLMT